MFTWKWFRETTDGENTFQIQNVLHVFCNVIKVTFQGVIAPNAALP